MSTQNLPTTCPSCSEAIQIKHLECANCQTSIEGVFAMPDILQLSQSELKMMLSFFMAKGKYRKLTATYNKDYRTIKKELETVIEKLEVLFPDMKVE